MLRHFTLKRVIVLKGVIAVGLLSAYFLPAEAAIAVGASANLFWLFKF